MCFILVVLVFGHDFEDVLELLEANVNAVLSQIQWFMSFGISLVILAIKWCVLGMFNDEGWNELLQSKLVLYLCIFAFFVLMYWWRMIFGKRRGFSIAANKMHLFIDRLSHIQLKLWDHCRQHVLGLNSLCHIAIKCSSKYWVCPLFQRNNKAR